MYETKYGAIRFNYNILGNDNIYEHLMDLVPAIESHFQQIQETSGRKRERIDVEIIVDYTYIPSIHKKEKQSELSKLKNKRSKLDEQIRLLENREALEENE